VIAELTDWLLYLHILGAIVWLGGLVMLSLLATLVLRSRDGEAVTRFVGSLPEPHPRADTVDQIETSLKRQVCGGALTLARARRRISLLKHSKG
jgi:hypothetical protein